MRVPSRCWPLRLAAVTPMLAKEGRRLPVSKPATPAGPSNCHLDHHHTGAFIGPVSPTSARGSRPSASLASRRPPTEAATVRICSNHRTKNYPSQQELKLRSELLMTIPFIPNLIPTPKH
ncbi:uncharacterized protein LOC131695749 isoform X1 [Topomyia yanbarensis]|uniref:uncharacterized protein LOC131695749 isoform X1 n=1 Tax=Topomyia yanbarensis TaxID=2498891 RepID=UPI00273C95D4|nr:uncharacterized protein LOC131695749 isoform X1 [Topomyia yanbarensis]